MGERYIDVGWYQDPERVSRYYENRVARLIGLAERLSGRFVFLESEALLTQTDEVLQRLSEFLELDGPLTRHYSVFAHTGQPGYGDPSQSILSGEVKPTVETREALRIPAPMAAHLKLTYDEGAKTLLRLAFPHAAIDHRQGYEHRDFERGATRTG
jgi:hypothetical protein